MIALMQGETTMKIPHTSANSDFPDLPDLSDFSNLTSKSVPLQICSETVTDESLHTLAAHVVSALQHANKTVATAESLTGGYIAKTLTDISGASAVLEGAVVSYSDRIKHKLLGVQTQTLQTYTAVSAQTAAEMAEGIRLAVGADIGISVTGVAGPTGARHKRLWAVCFWDVRHKTALLSRVYNAVGMQTKQHLKQRMIRLLT